MSIYVVSLSIFISLLKCGVTLERERDFRVVLSTRKAGETTIKLNVQISSAASSDIIHPGALMKDEIQLQVLPTCPLSICHIQLNCLFG